MGLGVVVFSLRLLAGWNAVRELRVAADATDALWLERFNRLKTRLGVSYAVRLVFSTSAAVPMRDRLAQARGARAGRTGRRTERRPA